VGKQRKDSVRIIFPKGKKAFNEAKRNLEKEYGKDSPNVYATLVAKGLYVRKSHGHSKAIRRAQRGNTLGRFTNASHRRGGTLDKFTKAAGSS